MKLRHLREPAVAPPDRSLRRWRELGNFLRKRREALTPQELGLPERQRARTPGLRREDIAELAGLSAAWYTLLEQGRGGRPSRGVIERLAKAMRLTPDEFRYVSELAQLALPATHSLVQHCDPSLQRVLDSMHNVPAYLVNIRWDRIAWNRAAAALFGNMESGDWRQRNALWRTFIDTNVRERTEDWQRLAQVLLAEFNASCGIYADEPWLIELVDELVANSEEFRAWWPHRRVLARREKRVCFNNSLVGRLFLEHSTFQVTAEPQLSLCLFVPLEDEDTPARLARLVAQRTS